MSEVREWRLQVGVQQWAGLRVGLAGAPPTLMLHGWLDNAGSLLPLARALPGYDHHLPDLPGHGLSGHRPPGTWYHFIDYVGDLLAWLDASGLARVDLIGHSMGGAIATLLAAAFPERVQRLVLIEALGPLSRPAEQIVADIRCAIEARLKLDAKPLRVHPDRASARRARMQAGGLSEYAADCLLERALAPAPGGWIWRSDPRQTLPTPVYGTEQQYLAVLQAIRAPTLLVLAEPRTRYLDGPEAPARIAALRPQAVHWLPGGHHLHLENTAAVAAVVKEFLQTTKPS
jgi:pimeloyl-ACP methyl ester carboxylesterase